jgi:Ca2+-binding EF-hand superfamily protein
LIDIRALDHNEDGVVGYTDFLRFIKPQGFQKSSKVMNTNSDSIKLPLDLEYALLRLIQRELELHRKTEGLKEQLIQKHKICLQEAYFYIFNSQTSKNGFSMKHLKEFMIDNCGFDLIDEEVKAIFKRLDGDQDGIVTCEDYTSWVLPLHIDKKEQINWMNSNIVKLKTATEQVNL